MIVPIGAWALGEACRQLHDWQRTAPESAPPMVNVNLAARQLRDPGLIDDVACALAVTGLPADRLRLEIHEQTLMEELESRASTLRALRDLGVRLAIDDFGASASSLRHLRTLDTDLLKLDLSFAQRLASDDGDRAVVAAVTELAHALGMAVTAEGIETAEQLEAVRLAGCDHAQGFLFSRPVPAGDLRDRLARGTARIWMPEDAGTGRLLVTGNGRR